MAIEPGAAGAFGLFRCGCRSEVAARSDAGVDAYYKRATNLLDDGQFGQALVLTAFNYAKAYNTGVELKAEYQMGDSRPMGISPGRGSARRRSRRTNISSVRMRLPIFRITISTRITRRR